MERISKFDLQWREKIKHVMKYILNTYSLYFSLDRISPLRHQIQVSDDKSKIHIFVQEHVDT